MGNRFAIFGLGREVDHGKRDDDIGESSESYRPREAKYVSDSSAGENQQFL